MKFVFVNHKQKLLNVLRTAEDKELLDEECYRDDDQQQLGSHYRSIRYKVPPVSGTSH